MRDLVPSHLHRPVCQATKFLMGSMDGTVVRELASYQCRLCSNPGLGITNGLSLLVVSCFALRINFLSVSINKNQHFLIPNQSGNSGQRASLWDVPVKISI